MVRLRAVTWSAVSPCLGAAVEYLDGAGCAAGVDLLADQRMRHRVEEAFDLDIVVDPNAARRHTEHPMTLIRQWPHDASLNRLEGLPAADTQTAHLAPVHPFDGPP
jgi:hypothetical protein